MKHSNYQQMHMYMTLFLVCFLSIVPMSRAATLWNGRGRFDELRVLPARHSAVDQYDTDYPLCRPI